MDFGQGMMGGGMMDPGMDLPSPASSTTSVGSFSSHEPFMQASSPLDAHRPMKRARVEYEAQLSQYGGMPSTPEPAGHHGGEGHHGTDMGQVMAIFEHSQHEKDASNAIEASENEEDVAWAQRISDAYDRMARIEEALHGFHAQLDEVRLAQKNMPVPPPPDLARTLYERQHQMVEEVKATQAELYSIYIGAILLPELLVKLRHLYEELDVADNLLDLFRHELVFMVEGDHSTSHCFARMLVTKQPFPKTVKQGVKACGATEDPLLVCLLVAPKAEIQAHGCEVVAELQHEAYTKNASQLGVTNRVQKMDSDGSACFSDIKFPNGTRQKMVRVRFAVNVQYVQMNGVMGDVKLESNTSRPFIVMTNENQWETSAGALLKKEIFEKRSEAPWEQFANTLQLHYLRASRQEPSNPKRALSKSDLDYIHHTRFKRAPIISEKEFDEFWGWFGKVLHRIRHDKQFKELWLNGFIYGFISKPRSEEILRRESPGTLLIRFSEQKAGRVALASVKLQPNMPSHCTTIKHVMIDHPDIVSIPEYLRKKENLAWMIKLSTEFNPRYSVEAKEHKDTVIGKFISGGEGEATADGYDLDC